MGVYDNTYIGILQTAYASRLKEFPMPCVFTNCHNCLCAVGGTINTDVHKYAESACKKSGGIFVPPHEAVIHQYMLCCGLYLIGIGQQCLQKQLYLGKFRIQMLVEHVGIA